MAAFSEWVETDVKGLLDRRMPEASERLIHAATQPLSGNAEAELLAQELLRQQLAEAGEQELLACAERLETKRVSRRIGVWVIFGLMCCLGLCGQIRTAFNFGAQLLKSRGEMSTALLAGSEPAPMKSSPSRFSQDERWRLSQGAASLNAVPQFIFEKANQIDPDNGWFDLIAAAGAAQGAVTEVEVPEAEELISDQDAGEMAEDESKPQKLPKYAIQDGAKLDQAIGHLHSAAQKPRQTTYLGQILLEYSASAERPVTWAQQYIRLGSNPMMQLRYPSFAQLNVAVSAKAAWCAEHHDRDGFRQLLAYWQIVLRRWNCDSPDMLGNVVSTGMLFNPLPHLAEAAKQLEIPDEAVRLDGMLQRKEQFIAKIWGAESDAAIARQHGSLLAQVSVAGLGAFNIGSPLKKERLEPGLRADHAVLRGAVMRILFCVWFLPVLLLLPWRRAWMSQLAESLRRLLRESDCAWILIAGMLAPWVLYECLYRFTAFGAREYAIDRKGIDKVIAIQAAALFLLQLIWPLAIARLRLQKRAGLLHFGFAKWRSHLVVIGCLVLAVIMSGKYVASEVSEWLVLSRMMLGVSVMWLLWSLISWCVKRRPEQRLCRAMLRGAVLPAYLGAALVMALASVCYQKEESYWIQRDTVMNPPADKLGITQYETEVVESFNAKLRWVMDGK